MEREVSEIDILPPMLTVQTSSPDQLKNKDTIRNTKVLSAFRHHPRELKKRNNLASQPLLPTRLPLRGSPDLFLSPLTRNNDRIHSSPVCNNNNPDAIAKAFNHTVCPMPDNPGPRLPYSSLVEITDHTSA